MKYIKVSVGIIIKNNKIYITRGKYKTNIWEFPGGKIKKNENIVTGLKRELFEEVGIIVLKFRFFQYIKYVSCENVIKLYFFLVTRWIGRPYSKEGYCYIWKYFNSLKSSDFPSANFSIIASLKQYLVSKNSKILV